MPERPYSERERVADRQEPKFQTLEIVQMVREYVVLQIELRHERSRYMPVVDGWVRQALDCYGAREVKSALRCALQCWAWEQLSHHSGQAQLENEAETDIALERVFEAAGLKPILGVERPLTAPDETVNQKAHEPDVGAPGSHFDTTPEKARRGRMGGQ